jgi:hypothetical protein
MSGLSPLLGRFALTQYMGTIDGITLEIQSSSISSISIVTPPLTSSTYSYFNPFKTHIAGYTVDWHIIHEWAIPQRRQQQTSIFSTTLPKQISYLSCVTDTLSLEENPDSSIQPKSKASNALRMETLMVTCTSFVGTMKKHIADGDLDGEPHGTNCCRRRKT